MAKDNALQDKEQFTAKMSDEDLNTQIDAWETESQSVYDALVTVWQQNLAYYKGDQTGVKDITGRQSKAVENRIFMATETKMSNPRWMQENYRILLGITLRGLRFRL